MFTMGHTVDRKAVAEAAAEVSCPAAAAAAAYIGAADPEAPFMASLLSEFSTPLSSQPALCFDPTLLIYILKKNKTTSGVHFLYYSTVHSFECLESIFICASPVLLCTYHPVW
jgi:hypothetical protein